MATKVADDADAVAKRLKEIMDEKSMLADVDKATGDWLDLHGRRVDLTRNGSESDYAYRIRIKRAQGEANSTLLLSAPNPDVVHVSVACPAARPIPDYIYQDGTLWEQQGRADRWDWLIKLLDRRE